MKNKLYNEISELRTKNEKLQDEIDNKCPAKVIILITILASIIIFGCMIGIIESSGNFNIEQTENLANFACQSAHGTSAESFEGGVLTCQTKEIKVCTHDLGVNK